MHNSVDRESEEFAIQSSPESLASGPDISDEVNEGNTKKCNLALLPEVSNEKDCRCGLDIRPFSVTMQFFFPYPSTHGQKGLKSMLCKLTIMACTSASESYYCMFPFRFQLG